MGLITGEKIVYANIFRLRKSKAKSATSNQVSEAEHAHLDAVVQQEVKAVEQDINIAAKGSYVSLISLVERKQAVRRTTYLASCQAVVVQTLRIVNRQCRKTCRYCAQRREYILYRCEDLAMFRLAGPQDLPGY
jgi:hypothetical protein